MAYFRCLKRLVTFFLLFFLACAFYINPFYTRGEQIVMDARTHLGAPYVFGEAGEAAFDCSGLLLFLFQRHSVSLPHSAQEIGYSEKYRTLPSISQLRVGDIVCFDTVSDSDLSDHVGVYMGNNEFIHASSNQGKVTINKIDGYYRDHFSWGKRLISPYF